MSPTRREPALVEVLDDPIVRMLMAADRVDCRALRHMLLKVARSLKTDPTRLAA